MWVITVLIFLAIIYLGAGALIEGLKRSKIEGKSTWIDKLTLIRIVKWPWNLNL